ncbi:MAG: Yip1 family protein [Gaiellaceae bacterium]
MSERLWWSRAGLVLVRPLAVFEELRDDSPEESQARQEPVVAIVVVAGIAGVLATSFAGTLIEDEGLDALDVALWAFFGGALEGFALYFVVGALVFAGGFAVGSTWRYRHARHVLAYSAMPLAVSLPLWAVELGTEGGLGFDLVRTLVIAWASGLLVVGMRTLHAWTWSRTLAAAILPLLVPALVLARAYGAL